MAGSYSCVKCRSPLTPSAIFCDQCGDQTAPSLWTALQGLEGQIKDLRKGIHTRKPPHTPAPRPKKIPMDKFDELYKKGLNDREIARELGITFSRIYRLRRKLNLAANAPRGFPKSVYEKRRERTQEKKDPTVATGEGAKQV